MAVCKADSLRLVLKSTVNTRDRTEEKTYCIVESAREGVMAIVRQKRVTIADARITIAWVL